MRCGVAAATASLLFFAAARADDGDARPEVVPYRPTVSTPAALSAPGWLEAELGGLQQHVRAGDDVGGDRTSVPYAVKYAFTEDWGVRIGGELFAHTRSPLDGTRSGFGDTAVVLKRRFAMDEGSAFGLEAGGAFPTAHRGLGTGSGKPDWSANAIYSADLGTVHTDLNLVNTRLGSRTAGASRLQTLGAVALSRPLAERWTIAGELAGTHQRGGAGSGQVLGAVSYALRRDLVVDFGAAHGSNRASPTWQTFAGMTVLIGRID